MMNYAALSLLLAVCAAELVFSAFHMVRAEKYTRILLAPCMILCCFANGTNHMDRWMAAALALETVKNGLISFRKSSGVLTLILEFSFCGCMAMGLYRSPIWDLPAPHYTYTVFLIHIVAIAILSIKAYPLLSNEKLTLNTLNLACTGTFSACSVAAILYSFQAATVFLGLGAVLSFIHNVFTLKVSTSQKLVKLGTFEAMIIYIFSRVLLVFGSQLAL